MGHRGTDANRDGRLGEGPGQRRQILGVVTFPYPNRTEPRSFYGTRLLDNPARISDPAWEHIGAESVGRMAVCLGGILGHANLIRSVDPSPRCNVVDLRPGVPQDET